MYNRLRPVWDGGGVYSLASNDDTGTIVATSGAKGFYIHSTVATRIKITASAVPLGDMSAGPKGTVIPANVSMGPFDLAGSDSHIHVAGYGVTGTATITLV